MSAPVNLIADKLADREKMRRQALRVVVCLAFCTILGLSIVCATRAATIKTAAKLTHVEEEINLLKPRLVATQQLKTREARDVGVAEWATDIRIANQRSRKAVTRLASLVPRDVFLSEISLTVSGETSVLKVTGTALSLDEAATFIGNLSGWPEYDGVMLESTQSGELNGNPIINFQCSITLKSQDKS